MKFSFHPLPEKLSLANFTSCLLLNSVGFLFSLNTLFNIYLESCLGVYEFKLPVSLCLRACFTFVQLVTYESCSLV